MLPRQRTEGSHMSHTRYRKLLLAALLVASGAAGADADAVAAEVTETEAGADGVACAGADLTASP